MSELTSWDLSFIYPNREAFLEEKKEVEALIDKMASYQGHLGEEDKLKEYLTYTVELNEKLQKLYSYASHLSDLNKKDLDRATDHSSMVMLLQKLGAALSFENPEIIGLGKEKIFSFLENNPDFAQFRFGFEKLFRGQKFVLSGDKEKLLASYSPLLREGSTLYSQLSVSDYSPKEITLSDGKKVSVSQSTWTHLIEEAKTKEDRQAIFEALYGYFDLHKSTYGEIYNLVLQAQLAEVKSRGYSSILEEHLYHNAIPEKVFLNLIEVASKGSEPLKKYYRLRAKALGLEKHRSYDRFLKLAHSSKKYTYEEAKELFFASIDHFPADFKEKAREVLKPGYVDVYPADGKRSGAYSGGGSGVHPVILLNYCSSLEDVFTLAHESGHSIHTLYSMESQPIMLQDYTIFVAEIASTFNEHNLLDYLLSSGKMDKEDKIAMLQKQIDEICSTFYRQTLFAHYEYEISKLAEQGVPINYQVLSNKMKELYSLYYGIDIEEEKLKPLVWAYIPHLFYTPFYVYQYATSFTSSMLIYQRVKNKEEGAFEQYISLLRSGGSDYPVEQVKKAGVDLTEKYPFEAVVKRMGELVDELERLLEEK